MGLWLMRITDTVCEWRQPSWYRRTFWELGFGYSYLAHIWLMEPDSESELQRLEQNSVLAPREAKRSWVTGHTERRETHSKQHNINKPP